VTTPLAFVCIGDMHHKPDDRQPDRLAAFDQILREGKAVPHLAAWLVTGDIFDAGAAARDCNGIDERLQDMASVAPVVVCYGNHDRPGDLDGFARLAAPWPIMVVDRPWTVRFLSPVPSVDRQYVSIFVLPYPHRAGLVSLGLAPGAIVDAGADCLEPIFLTAAAELAEARARGDVTLMMGHVNVVGAVASTGQPQVGREIELGTRHLDRLGDIPKILGHIHKPQIVASGAYYVGSSCRLDYGEIEPKRWLDVTAFANMNSPIGVSYHIESHPLDVAPMFHVDGTLGREGFVIDLSAAAPKDADEAEVIRRYGMNDWTGCDVRVRYTYQASERLALTPELARLPFATARRLKVEGIAQADRELRAPAVVLAKTLVDKVAAYRHTPDLSSSIAGKVQLLEQGDDAATLAAVTATLTAIETPEVV
jgi:hypothetical protein